MSEHSLHLVCHSTASAITAVFDDGLEGFYRMGADELMALLGSHWQVPDECESFELEKTQLAEGFYLLSGDGDDFFSDFIAALTQTELCFWALLSNEYGTQQFTVHSSGSHRQYTVNTEEESLRFDKLLANEPALIKQVFLDSD